MQQNTQVLQTVPKAIDAEKCLLGSIIQDMQILEQVAEHIVTDSFYLDKHRYLYQILYDLFNQEKFYDVVGLIEHIRGLEMLDKIGGEVYLYHLINEMPVLSQIDGHISLVKEKHTLRQLLDVGKNIVNNSVKTQEEKSLKSWT